MKFAFSTVCAPNWDFDTLVAKASEYGYDGIELRGFLRESILSAANPFLSDPLKVKKRFNDTGIEIACLSSSITFTGSRRRDRRAGEDLTQYLDLAAVLGCPFVKIADTNVRPGYTRETAARALADALTPFGDYAADRGVMILVENLLSFRNAKELWLLLEMASHPAIGCCWDVFNAAIVGEHPAISVPTLNNRIQYVQVKDATLGPLGASFTKLGEGSVKLPDLFRRLKGIGYTGYISFEWEKAWLPNLAEPDEVLPQAITQLRQWVKPQIEEENPKAESDAAPAAAH